VHPCIQPLQDHSTNNLKNVQHVHWASFSPSCLVSLTRGPTRSWVRDPRHIGHRPPRSSSHPVGWPMSTNWKTGSSRAFQPIRNREHNHRTYRAPQPWCRRHLTRKKGTFLDRILLCASWGVLHSGIGTYLQMCVALWRANCDAVLLTQIPGVLTHQACNQPCRLINFAI